MSDSLSVSHPFGGCGLIYRNSFAHLVTPSDYSVPFLYNYLSPWPLFTTNLCVFSYELSYIGV